MNVDGLNYCELAHEIVRQTPCSTCGAKPSVRCVSKATERNPFGRTLAPSASHRPRIEGYWRRERAAGRLG